MTSRPHMKFRDNMLEMSEAKVQKVIRSRCQDPTLAALALVNRCCTSLDTIPLMESVSKFSLINEILQAL
jgi:hypothetical protein